MNMDFLNNLNPEQESLINKGLEIFDSKEALSTWLNTKQPELGNVTPFSCWGTKDGINKVKQLLDSISSGIYN